MKIKRIIIDNFRAFKHADFELNDFNCIIGQNDSGKSTIFAALEWFFDANKELKDIDFNTDNIIYDKYRGDITDGDMVSVEIHFLCDKSDGIHFNINGKDYYCYNDFIDNNGCLCIKKHIFHTQSRLFSLDIDDFVNPDSLPKAMGYSVQANYYKSIGRFFSGLTIDELKNEGDKIGIYFNDLKEEIKSEFKMQSNLWYQLYAFDDFERETRNRLLDKISDFYKRECIRQWYDIDNNDFLNQDVRFQKFCLYRTETPLNDYLKLLFVSSEADNLKKELKILKDKIGNQISDEVFESHQSESFSFSDNYDFLVNCELLAKNSIPLSHRGEGFQLKIKNAVFRMLVKKKRLTNGEGRDFVFAFEEPETHLHPSAQIEMYKTIKKLSENSNYQVFMTTHSPYIVKELAKDNIMPIVVTRDEEKQTSYISKLDEKVLSYDSMNEINYIAFGEPSIAYHIELFGFIHNKLMNKYENDSNFKNVWDSSIVAPDKNGVSVKVGVSTIKGVDVWLEVKNGAKKYNWYETKNFTKEKRTLPYCVRNNIDHPLTEDDTSNINKHRAFVNNAKFEKYIQQSIDIMRNAIINNPNVFK